MELACPACREIAFWLMAPTERLTVESHERAEPIRKPHRRAEFRCVRRNPRKIQRCLDRAQIDKLEGLEEFIFLAGRLSAVSGSWKNNESAPHAMTAYDLVSIVVWALLVSGVGAAFLALIPALTPERKRYFARFGYCFSNYSLPGWFALELVLWLILRRWVPWMPTP
jgi:hypothetical protein